MQPETASSPGGHAVISDVAKIKEQTVLQRVFASQAFWVTDAKHGLTITAPIHVTAPGETYSASTGDRAVVSMQSEGGAIDAKAKKR